LLFEKISSGDKCMKENRLILILGLAGFVVMADNWVVSPILPAIARSLQVSPVQAGILISAYMIPFGLFQLIFGPLADRYGKQQVITFSMIFFTIGTALCGLGLGLFDLGLYRAVTGIFAASVMPISLALIGDVIPMERRQQAIGTFMGIAFLGQGLSMAIGGSIAYFVSWRGVFFAYAALSVISTILLFSAGRHASSKRNPHSLFLKPYLDLIGTSKSLLVYLIVLFEGILIIGSFSYLGAYTELLFHFNYLYIGLTLTAFGAGAVITGRLVGKIVPRLGRPNTLLLGLIVAMGADFLLYGIKTSVLMLIVGVALLGIGFMLAHSSLLTIATEFAKMARGTAMSLVAFCFMGGGGVGTAIGGRVISAIGYPRFYGLYGLFLFGLVMATFAIVREAKG
jgi:predicted MFS family arabinose efflux permease